MTMGIANAMDNYRAILVDDEPLLRQYLQNSLGDLWPELDIVGTAGDGEQALLLVNQQEPDLIFLDIRMPVIDGLTVAKQLSLLDSPPLIVFITAYDQYAVDAFEQEAVDYLLKPFDDARLEKALFKVRTRLDARSKDNENLRDSISKDALFDLLTKLEKKNKNQKLTWIKAMRQEHIYLVAPDDVCYFQAEDKYTTVVTPDNEYIIRTSIKDLNEQLDENIFLQIRRGTLVNSKHIEKIHRDFSGRMYVHVKGRNEQLQISRSFSASFKQM